METAKGLLPISLAGGATGGAVGVVGDVFRTRGIGARSFSEGFSVVARKLVTIANELCKNRQKWAPPTA